MRKNRKAPFFQELGIDDNVFVGVELLTSDSGVNIIVEKAWATPLPTASASPINIPIVDDRLVYQNKRKTPAVRF